MPRSNVSSLLHRANVVVEELEISLRALDRASNQSLENNSFHEIESCLQEIRGWIYQRQQYLSSEKAAIAKQILASEIEAYRQRASRSGQEGPISDVVKRVKELINWLV